MTKDGDSALSRDDVFFYYYSREQIGLLSYFSVDGAVITRREAVMGRKYIVMDDM